MQTSITRLPDGKKSEHGAVQSLGGKLTVLPEDVLNVSDSWGGEESFPAEGVSSENRH